MRMNRENTHYVPDRLNPQFKKGLLPDRRSVSCIGRGPGEVGVYAL